MGMGQLRKRSEYRKNTGKGMKVASWMRFYLTWILPVLFLIVFIMGII